MCIWGHLGYSLTIIKTGLSQAFHDHVWSYLGFAAFTNSAIMLRRSHKKSRAGCSECKRRHIKVNSSSVLCSLSFHVTNMPRPFIYRLSVVRNNGMVARELPLGPARWSCIYMVFAPYLTLLSIRNIHCTNITATPLQLHPFIRLFRYRLSL
jgi:hypothetical protein